VPTNLNAMLKNGGRAEPVIGRAFARPVGFAHPAIAPYRFPIFSHSQRATASGDDAPSPQDGGAAETSVTNATSAGDAGAAAFCSAVCAGLLACSAGVDAGPCHCSAGSAALERKDFVDTFTSCVQGAIVADCADAGGAVQDCQVSAAAAIAPTPAAANFCKNLEFTFCADVLPDCLTNAGIYSDTTIAALSNCLPDAPDADLDGGCSNFANCLNIASQP